MPDEVIHLVADARESIDSLSMQILDLDVMQGDSKEIRAIIEENIGKYVNRAYRIHQGGWSPSRKAVADAVDYLATNIQKHAQRLVPQPLQNKLKKWLTLYLGRKSYSILQELIEKHFHL